MERNLKYFHIFYSKFSHFYYWNVSIVKSKLFGSSNKTILLSNLNTLDWNKRLKLGFQKTKYKFEFNVFSEKNITNYDCVIPISIEDLLFTDKNRDLIPNNPMPTPSKKSIDFCNDKFIFNTEMIRLGFKDFIPNMGTIGNYPYMLKKKIDVSGENSFIIYNKEKENEKIQFINNRADYFTQELIPGKHEYATHILFKNKRIAKSLNIKYTFNKVLPIKGKDKHLYTTICGCPHLEIFQFVLNSINFEGMCCFNYKEFNNKPMIIEINPRVGNSLSKYLFSFVDIIL